jgi:pimeloyl-ACP methyl ester carboxylesterase
MESTHEPKFIQTNLGRIAVYQRNPDTANTPIIFLHGVYFDHHLWDRVIESIQDRTTYSIDMPFHGLSKEITKNDWTLDDCAEMFLEILDGLQISEVIAVGHSWGSMTILRAACRQPQKFKSVLLCNMPFKAASKGQKLIFGLQHVMVAFRNFYSHQAAKALFGKTSIKEMPLLYNELKRPMDLLSNRQVRQIDHAVIIEADDAVELIKSLPIKAVALKGEEDYVPSPPDMETFVVKGGHVSPLEQPGDVINLVSRLIYS